MTDALRPVRVMQDVVANPATGRRAAQSCCQGSMRRDAALGDLTQQVLQMLGKVRQVLQLIA